MAWSCGLETPRRCGADNDDQQRRKTQRSRCASGAPPAAASSGSCVSRLTPPRRGVAPDAAADDAASAHRRRARATGRTGGSIPRPSAAARPARRPGRDRSRQGRLVEAIGLRRRQRPVGIGADARGGFGRRQPGDGVMQHRGGGIDVAPRALLAVERVLLDRRVLRRQHAGQRARAVAHRLARRAEVDQHRHAVAPDDDVGRLDVAMQEALGMHGAETAQQPVGQAAHLVGRQAAGRLRAAARPRSCRPRTP